MVQQVGILEYCITLEILKYSHEVFFSCYGKVKLNLVFVSIGAVEGFSFIGGDTVHNINGISNPNPK